MRLSTFVALFIVIMPVGVKAADLDGDGLQDEWELSYFSSLAQQSAAGDPDGDGLFNLEEEQLGTDPTLADTDGDGLDDRSEVEHVPPLNPLDRDTDGDSLTDYSELSMGTDPTKADTDSDGLTDFIEVLRGLDPLFTDSDGGGLWDGQEVLVDGTDPLDPTDDQIDSDGDGIYNYWESVLGTSPFSADTDGDWLLDGQEESNLNGVWEPDLGETSPFDADTDGDGLHDGWEVLVYKTDPFKPDTDDDGLTDGAEHDLRNSLYPCLDPKEADSDGDGISDYEEVELHGSDPCSPDTDFDGVLDPSELHDGTSLVDAMSVAVDTDGDGLSDDFEAVVSGSDPTMRDTDADGLDDAEEWLPLTDRFITDPVDADTDDDGVLDGNEGGMVIGGALTGGTSPISADTDGDGLGDGLEKGLTEPQVSPLDPDATAPGTFVADQDPSTKTSPAMGDTDGDGLKDGVEDANGNGVWDAGETDPLKFDTDGDGIDDGWETTYSTQEACSQPPLGPLDPLDPADAVLDNDGDGLTNLKEYTLTWWDGGQEVKNQTNPCLLDSDGDQLRDGLEVKAKYGPATPSGSGSNPNAADTDGDGLPDGVEDANHDGQWFPATETNPLRKDTDSDGLMDGKEDANGNGLVDEGETDPKVKDTDGDGISDGDEVNRFGTDPLVADTDEDGLLDGLEVGLLGDLCPESRTSPLLPDTDGDGLLDGAEDKNADGCFDPDEGETNPLSQDSDGDKLSDSLELGLGNDADPTTTTDPLNKDSDGDGLWDSHEDLNKDGAVDAGESDPNLFDTDGGGVDDGTEVLLDGTSPVDPADDGTADPDGDGLINYVELELGTDRFSADTDGDSIPDGVEVGDDPGAPLNSDGDALIDALDQDSDADGIPDLVEAGDSDLATAPVDSDGDGEPDYRDTDADDDGIPDSVEWTVDANLDGAPDPDADGDGTANFRDDDSDDDGKSDLEEGTGDTDMDGIPNFVDPDDSDGPNYDSDGDGLSNMDEGFYHTDPFNPDTDGDGLGDKQEIDLGTNPLDRDSDDDGLLDGLESAEDGDGDWLIGPLDPDSDDDGLFDGTESGVVDPELPYSYKGTGGLEYAIEGTDLAAKAFVPDQDPLTVTSPDLRDSDDDGYLDGAEDANHNGMVDEGESDPADPLVPANWSAAAMEFFLDSDGDGLTDRQELSSGLNPMDADNDDDGLLDGAEHNWRHDTDGDGLVNALDADSDGDALPDGLEQGLVATDWHQDSRPNSPNLVADRDPASTTAMLLWDSDGDELRDGAEDVNHNGLVDGQESSPLVRNEEQVSLADSDSDGISDLEELAVGLEPKKWDSDDDGVSDGSEPNWSVDSEGDGLVGALDPDSDDDGLADGTELGLSKPDEAGDTNVERGNFYPDLFPSSGTNPLLPDTDGDGVSDGGEDTNKDGNVDSGESDPNNGSEPPLFVDSDGDLLSDQEEDLFGTDPLDADSDDDGVPDGLEHNWRFDTDGDGLVNALDPDSDQDKLLDGTEEGVETPLEAVPPAAGSSVGIGGTDLAAGNFLADTDSSTVTFMLVADTDGGGALDGDEDLNGNGNVDPLEIDPNLPEDDGLLSPDADGDGILNEDEGRIGTDPLNPDTDGDTIPDGVEVGDDHENPLDSDGDGTIDALDDDSDDDGIADSTEAGDDDLETPPADTDEDGVPDYLDLDSDDDGLTDKEEAAVYQTDPTLKDTDGGGADDYLETQIHKSDPLDPSDDFVGWLEDGAHIEGGPGCSTAGGNSTAWPLAVLLVLITALLAAVRGRGNTLWLFIALILAAGLLADAQPARADWHPDAKYTLLEANAFRLDPDSTGVLNVYTDQLPDSWRLYTGASLHYVDSSARVVRDNELLRELMPYRLEMQLSAVLGILGFMEVGAHLPLTLYQEAQYAGFGLGDAGWGGVGNAQLFAKIQFLDGRKERAGVALLLPVALPTATDTGYHGYEGFGVHPTLIVGKRYKGLGVHLNLGYLFKERHTLFHLVTDDQITSALGFEFSPLKGDVLRLQASANMAVRADAPFIESEEVLAEANAGVKVKVGDFTITAGGGKGLTNGFGVPDFRVFTQVTYDVGLVVNPDRDGDGIPNEKDECPDKAEDFDQFEDLDGCPDPDNDQDRIPDVKDKCKNDPEDHDRFEDEDGCPDPDNDQDGIPDERDRCPLDAEDMDGFQDDDGCPDLDNDGDGIPDAKDECPNEKEIFNDYKDEDGCPDKKLAELQAEEKRIQINQKIHFKFRSAELMSESLEILDQVAQILLDSPQLLVIQVEGHTDKLGTKWFNDQLSLDRANSVVDYLVSKGVKRERLKPVGFGFTRRIDYRPGAEANYNNRRVEFNVIEMAPAKPQSID